MNFEPSSVIGVRPARLCRFLRVPESIHSTWVNEGILTPAPQPELCTRFHAAEFALAVELERHLTRAVGGTRNDWVALSKAMYMLRSPLRESPDRLRLAIWDLDLRTAEWADTATLPIAALCHGRPIRLIPVRDAISKMLRHFDSEVAFDRYRSELPAVIPKHVGRGRPKGAAAKDRMGA